MKVTAIIQARMGSSRLPGKILKDLCGQPAIVRMLERVRRATKLDQIIVATTTEQKDNTLVEMLEKVNQPYFRGSENDVLGRFYETWKQYGGGTIMRLTADNPLTDPDMVDDAVQVFGDSDYDYLRYGVGLGLPLGMGMELFHAEGLEKAFHEAADPREREHVTPYFYWHPALFRCGEQRVHPDHSDLRWTVDTPEDYTLVREIYQELYPINPYFSYQDVLNAYEKHPEWRNINSTIEQKTL